MKTKNIILAALLISGMTAFAKDQVSSRSEAGSDFLKTRKAHKSPFKFSSSGKELDADGLVSSGLFINAGIFLPSSSYLNHSAGSSGKLFKIGFDAEVGNYFKILKVSRFSVGLRATWLSVGFTHYGETYPFLGTVSINALSGSIVRVGPQACFALSDKVAIDVFYQIGAQYILGMSSASGHSDNTSFLGISHEIGAGVRYNIFNLGVGYRLGSVKNLSDDGDDYSYSVNNLRIFVGIKF